MSKINLPRLFGEVFTLMAPLSDFYCRIYSNEEGDIVEFDFGCDMPAGKIQFFQDEDIEDFLRLLSESGLDSDAQAISVEDQVDFPNGAKSQIDYFGFANLELLTTRQAISTFSSSVRKLKSRSTFDEELHAFLTECLDAIGETLHCWHVFEVDEKAFFGTSCQYCRQSYSDPDRFLELASDIS